MLPEADKNQINNTKLAVWTIILGAVLALILPWALTHLAYGVSFTETGQIGDTIGGITGPILNFAGLLVVYFSLREQFLSNQIQIQNFEEEQRRSTNENTISTAFKLIDDLRTEANRIRTQVDLGAYFPSGVASYIDDSKYPDFGFVNYSKEPQLLRFNATFDEAGASEGYEFERVTLDYFQLVANETKVLRATLDMFIYLINNSQLPPSQCLHLYHIVLAFYEPLVIDLLGGLEIFSHYRKPIEELVHKVLILEEDQGNSWEALVDLNLHEPGGNW